MLRDVSLNFNFFSMQKAIYNSVTSRETSADSFIKRLVDKKNHDFTYCGDNKFPCEQTDSWNCTVSK